MRRHAGASLLLSLSLKFDHSDLEERESVCVVEGRGAGVEEEYFR